METPEFFYRPVTCKNILVYLKAEWSIAYRNFLNVRLFALLFDIEKNDVFSIEETAVCVFISANIQELISKHTQGERGNGKVQLVIVSTLGGNVGLSTAKDLQMLCCLQGV